MSSLFQYRECHDIDNKQVQIEKKEKNESREEIFYQMKVFFC